MKKLLVLTLLALSTQAQAETRIKPGLWEVHIVKQIVDGQDMTMEMTGIQSNMPALMAALSPEQRKQVERAMGKQGMNSADLKRICISPEMATRNTLPMPANANCQPGSFNRSGNRITFQFNCTNANGQGEALIGKDSIQNRVDAVTKDSRGQHKLHSETRLSFLGSDCQGVKPADQIARETQSARH